jgi:hypothetical protein
MSGRESTQSGKGRDRNFIWSKSCLSYVIEIRFKVILKLETLRSVRACYQCHLFAGLNGPDDSFGNTGLSSRGSSGVSIMLAGEQIVVGIGGSGV